MSLNRAEQIVADVQRRHPKLEPIAVYVTGGGGILRFSASGTNPTRAAVWFRDCGYPVSQVGYDVKSKVWVLYFSEKEVV